MPAIRKRTPRPATTPINRTMLRREVEPTDDQIRERAYRIFLSRNGAPGDPQADWNQARCELQARIALQLDN